MTKNPEHTQAARHLRRRQTEAEKMLWSRLRDRRSVGVKFRRQQPVGPYVVDFVSLKERVVVEVDGGQHGEPASMHRDEERTAWLTGKGYRVLRFWNNEVLANADGVLERILDAVGRHSPSPLRLRSGQAYPSPVKGEGSAPPLEGGS